MSDSSTGLTRTDLPRGSSSLWPRLLGLCCVPILFCLLDTSVTLAGQSADYWSGNFSEPEESCPTLFRLLSIHPVAFVGGMLIWIVAFTVLIVLLPDVLALIASIGITFGHTAGAASWLLWRYQYGYQECNALFLVAATGLGLGIYYGWRWQPQTAVKYLPRISMAWRVGIVSSVLMGATYMFLWPQNPCFDKLAGVVASLANLRTEIP